MMMRVEATLEAAARTPEGARGVLHLAPEGDRRVNVAKARRLAAIEMDFPAGSDRPVFGPAIGFAKRAVRRSIRWYLRPMIDQQTRVNQSTLDLIEGLRLNQERLARRLEAPSEFRAVSWFAGCRRVVDVSSGADVDGLDVRSGTVEGLAAMGPVDGVLASAVSSTPAEIVALLEASYEALSADGRLAVVTSASTAVVPAGALAWAVGAAGFRDVRQLPVAAVAGELSVEALTEVAAASSVAVVGVK